MNVSQASMGHRPSQVKVGPFGSATRRSRPCPVGAFDLWALQFSVITGRYGCIVAA